MPLSRRKLKTAINTIIDSEVLERVMGRLIAKYPTVFPLHRKIARMKETTKASQLRRLDRIKEKAAHIKYLTGDEFIDDPALYEGNIENFIGLAQVPVGVIGPLRINGVYANDDFYVPLATTEGALVASYNRGAKVISLSGGATSMVLSDSISRAPGFVFNNLTESGRFVAWCAENYEQFKSVAHSASNFGRLQDMQTTIDGNYVYLTFQFSTGDAAGQNMVTISTDAICQYIVQNSSVKPRRWYIEANLSGDKKATKMSHMNGRGKHVMAEITIKRELVHKVLRTTPEKMVEYEKMATHGGIHTGSIGTHGHYANALAAIFLACGQDVACVSEASIGTSRAEITEKGDLYVSVSLPNLVVGTVGGGTHLPTQKECLTLMDCYGPNKARKFAEICAVAVLAGELSIAAAISAGHFTQAHLLFARKAKVGKEEINEGQAVKV